MTCDQGRLRSVAASAQSDQSLWWSHVSSTTPRLSIEEWTKILAILDGCTGWSASLWVTQVLGLVVRWFNSSCPGRVSITEHSLPMTPRGRAKTPRQYINHKRKSKAISSLLISKVITMLNRVHLAQQEMTNMTNMGINSSKLPQGHAATLRTNKTRTIALINPCPAKPGYALSL